MNDLKIQRKELAVGLGLALANLNALKYFPQSVQAQQAILKFLEGLVGDEDQLKFLVEVLRDRVGEWPGTAEVRGLYCLYFRPHDGREADCSLPGFTPAEMERSANDKRRLIPPKQKLKELPAPASQEEPREQMSPQELREFHNTLLRGPSVRGVLSDRTAEQRERDRRVERSLSSWKPKRTEEETRRIIAELESQLQRG